MVLLERVLQQWDAVLIFIRDGLAEVRPAVELSDSVAAIRVALDDGDVVLFHDFNLDTDRILSVQVGILLKVDTDHAVDLRLVFFVTAKEVLNVLVLRQRKLGEGKYGRIELQSVHFHRLNSLFHGLLDTLVRLHFS